MRTYKLGEADRILVLLGEQSGQFRAVAKGIRRTTSKFGARLQPFNIVDVQCYRGRQDLHTITQAHTLSAYSSKIAADYAAFTNAKLMVEAVQRSTEGHDLGSQEQFALLHGALHALASRSKPGPLITASYLLRMAALEGWQPTLTFCAHCETPGSHPHFSLSSGGSMCDDCASPDAAEVPTEVLVLMEDLLAGNWAQVASHSSQYWGEAMDLAGLWVQWQVEQRLRSLPFAATMERT